MSLPRPVAAVVFDMDGVLFDTEAIYEQAMLAAGREIGIDITAEFFRSTIGTPWPVVREHMLERFGPDFAIEIISPEDSSRDKLDFYAKVGVRELLIVDRAPWRLESYRLEGCQLLQAGCSSLDAPESLRSNVVPLSFRMLSGGARSMIEVTHHDGVQRWIV